MGSLKGTTWLVVLNWNNGTDTVECLDSVCAAGDHAVAGVVVCDNGSNDDSMERLRNWAVRRKVDMPELHLTEDRFKLLAPGLATTSEPVAGATRYVLLQTGFNRGFAGGNNVGLRYLQEHEDFDYAFLLNNDAMLTPGCVSAMVVRMQADARVGMCGCTVVYHHARALVQAWGGAQFQPWLCRASHVGSHAPVTATPVAAEVDRQLDYILGAALMISRPCLDAVGLMEERYFLYYEEIDWALRAKRAGYGLAFAPGATVFHKEGGTIGSSADKSRRSLLSEHYMVRSALLFTRKFYPWYLPTVLAFLAAKTLQTLLRRDARRVWVRLRAMAGLGYSR